MTSRTRNIVGTELLVGRAGRAAMLRLMAAALESDADQLIGTADRKTALGLPRLGAELACTCFQLRFTADLLDEGSHLEATIDHAVETPVGPLPDLRRMMRGIGAVGVFAASNFPFAFSVAGGDTASALAAGCAVIVKAHEGHPLTSRRQCEALTSAVREAGAPQGTLSLIFGRQAEVEMIQHPLIAAVGFTGSLDAGRKLYGLACSRPVPIPFYGELGALNAMVVTQAAADERPEDIARGVSGSFTLGNGQFCTKPGLLLLPTGAGGIRVRDEIGRLVANMSASPVLTPKTADSFTAGLAARTALPDVALFAQGSPPSPEGLWATPAVLEAPIELLAGPLLDECFGAVLVVSTYRDQRELMATLTGLSAALTFTVADGEAALGLAPEVIELMVSRVGRVVWNGFPTGVAVSWSMQHGGPYPAATSSSHTSVGGASIRRWLRPVSYQNFPAHLLPVELRDTDGVDIPRRVDGQLLPQAVDRHPYDVISRDELACARIHPEKRR